jgi:hypothetical protein
MRALFLTTTLIAFAGLAATCGSSSSPDTQPAGYGTQAVLTHSGFDFSSGTTGAGPGYDGETVNWVPDGGVNPTYPNMDQWIWWRNTHLALGVNRTQDMGMVPLESVSMVLGVWDVGAGIPPLRVGHVIVAACDDGYVKFRVDAVNNANTQPWDATVTYVWSSTTTFP